MSSSDLFPTRVKVAAGAVKTAGSVSSHLTRNTAVSAATIPEKLREIVQYQSGVLADSTPFKITKKLILMCWAIVTWCVTAALFMVGKVGKSIQNEA